MLGPFFKNGCDRSSACDSMQRLSLVSTTGLAVYRPKLLGLLSGLLSRLGPGSIWSLASSSRKAIGIVREPNLHRRSVLKPRGMRNEQTPIAGAASSQPLSKI